MSVRDDGSGIHCAPSDRLETVFEGYCKHFRSTGTADGHWPHVHLGKGMIGSGIPAVSALSSRLVARTTHRGFRQRLVFERGHVVERSEPEPTDAPSGTEMSIVPDEEIFGDARFDADAIAEHLQQIADLNPALRVHLQVDDAPARDLSSPRGLVARLERSVANPENTWPERPLRIRGVHVGVTVEAVLWWRADVSPRVTGFVSQFRTNHGTHVEGLRDALDQAWSRHGLRLHRLESFFRLPAAIVHAELDDPAYGTPTKERLASQAAREAVAHVVGAHLDRWLSSVKASHPRR